MTSQAACPTTVPQITVSSNQTQVLRVFLENTPWASVSHAPRPHRRQNLIYVPFRHYSGYTESYFSLFSGVIITHSAPGSQLALRGRHCSGAETPAPKEPENGRRVALAEAACVRTPRPGRLGEPGGVGKPQRLPRLKSRSLQAPQFPPLENGCNTEHPRRALTNRRSSASRTRGAWCRRRSART